MSWTQKVLTIQEVAEYLQLTSETVYRYVRQGKLVATKLGRRYRIPRENVELFLLATSIAGEARPRTLSEAQMGEWLEEDRIDRDTRSIGEGLLASLRES